MSETAYFLHDLIKLSRNGTEFYEEAARAVPDKKLSRVFTDMAKAKTALADNLASELKPEHKKAAKPIDLVDEVGQTYAGMRTGLKAVNSANITALELTESQIQVSLQKVVMDRDNSFVIRVLAKQYVHAAENLKAELRSRKRLMS
jgi:uncharacterized protein (TIGR02284 family)